MTPLLFLLHEKANPLTLFALKEKEQKRVEKALKKTDFSGKKGEFARDPQERVIFYGLGKEKSSTYREVWVQCRKLIEGLRIFPETTYQVGAEITWQRQAKEERWLAIQRILAFSSYSFGYQNKPPKKIHLEPLPLKKMEPSTFQSYKDKLKVLIEGETFTRDLANTPPNRLTPLALAEKVAEKGKEKGWEVEIWEKERLKKEKMEGMLAVGGSSIHDPVLLILKLPLDNSSTKPFVLIGKGVLFDSGGISLKPPKKMEEMKYDKSGACVLAGLIPILPTLPLKRSVILYLPLVENLPSHKAYRPSDILTFRDGTSVEILNTDAEGRLILADCLSLAKEKNPYFTLDLATLTGACAVALGQTAAGVMGNHQGWIRRLIQAGKITHQWVWELPLWREYEKPLKAKQADLYNVGGPYGGAITAGAFLKHFIHPKPWCHLDIAGVAYEDGQNPIAGSTGWGVHLLAHFIENYL